MRLSSDELEAKAKGDREVKRMPVNKCNTEVMELDEDELKVDESGDERKKNQKRWEVFVYSRLP